MHFWREAPADLKWITLGLPIVVIIVFQATIQKRHANAAKPETEITQQIAQTGIAGSIPIREVAVRPAPIEQEERPNADEAGLSPASAASQGQGENSESGLFGPLGKFFGQRMQNLRLNLAERAGVELSDDFRSGLAAWGGQGDWARSWNYDRVGMLRPGQLALYQPSVGLTDYRLEFAATAERGAIGWVFRARDTNNYYGMRLQVMKSGAGTQASLERWIVSGGRVIGRKFIPLRMPVWEGNISQVRMDVEGSSFTTFVNGQIADTWSDSRIGFGGVGFFNDKGCDARIHKMSISHQNDAVGKLCAMLVPHDLVIKQQSSGGRIDR